MVSLREVHKQLKQVGYRFSFWMRREVIELSQVLDTDETIKQCVNGYYQGGFAILAATNLRLILIDRKPMFLTLEVLWYDKIGQIDYNHRLLNATICVATPNKDLTFTSYNNPHLRQLLLYTQEKMADANKPEKSDESEDRAEIHANWQYQGRPKTITKVANSSSVVPEGALLPQTEATSGDNTMNLSELESKQLEPTKKLSYSAARLPFSRRRYFTARQPQEF